MLTKKRERLSWAESNLAEEASEVHSGAISQKAACCVGDIVLLAL